jgi:hypothetical protein
MFVLWSDSEQETNTRRTGTYAKGTFKANGIAVGRMPFEVQLQHEVRDET